MADQLSEKPHLTDRSKVVRSSRTLIYESKHGFLDVHDIKHPQRVSCPPDLFSEKRNNTTYKVWSVD